MNVFGYMGNILVSNDKGLGTTKWPILHAQPLQQIIICLRVLEGSVLSLGFHTLVLGGGKAHDYIHVQRQHPAKVSCVILTPEALRELTGKEAGYKCGLGH